MARAAHARTRTNAVYNYIIRMHARARGIPVHIYAARILRPIVRAPAMATSLALKKPRSEFHVVDSYNLGATPSHSAGRRGLEERLAAGETILCAEGYLIAFSRAGYVLQGLWVPEFVLDYPDVLRQQH